MVSIKVILIIITVTAAVISNNNFRQNVQKKISGFTKHQRKGEDGQNYSRHGRGETSNSSAYLNCPQQNSGTIQWPQTYAATSNVLSTPLCLDRFRIPIVRNCSETANWEPSVMPPQCAFIQSKSALVSCPIGFDEYRPIDKRAPICLQLTKPEQFSTLEQRQQSAQQTIYDVPFEYRSFVGDWLRNRTVPVNAVWMKAKYFWGDTRWRSPSKYGEPVTEFSVLNRLSPGCLMVNTTTNKFIGSSVQCTNRLPSLLIYYDATNQTTIDRICDHDYVGTHLLDTVMCFNVVRASPNKQISFKDVMVVDSGRRARILLDLFGNRFRNVSGKSSCLFKPIPMTTNGALTKNEWHLKVAAKISYVNWQPSAADNNISVSFENNLLMIDPLTTEWYFGQSFEYVAYQRTGGGTGMNFPSLKLNLWPATNEIILTVENENYLWGLQQPEIKCFVRLMVSAANNVSKVALVSVDMTSRLQMTNTKTTYKLTANNQTGYYSCSGFWVHTFSAPISSKEMFGSFSSSTFNNRSFAVQLMHSRDIFCQQILESYATGYLWKFIDTHSIAYQMDLIHIELIQRSGHAFLYHIIVQLQSDFKSTEPNRLGIIDREHLEIYHLRNLLTNLLNQTDGELLLTQMTGFVLQSISSTVLCVPPSISQLERLNWFPLWIGQMGVAIEPVVCDMNIVPIRLCNGNALEGAAWLSVTESEQNCRLVTSELTIELIRMLENFTDPSATPTVLTSLSKLLKSCNAMNRKPIDVFYISLIMKRVVELKYSKMQSQRRKCCSIYDEIMDSDDRVLRLSAMSNATNSLLDTWDSLLRYDDEEEMKLLKNETFELRQQGVHLIRTSKLILAIIDPSVKPYFSGVGLFSDESRSNLSTDDLNRYSLQLLTKYQHPLELLTNDSLEIATYVSARLLANFTLLGNGRREIKKIVITIFSNDKLFQAKRNSAGIRPRADGLIMSLSIPDHDGDAALAASRPLPGIVSTFFRSSTVDYDAFAYDDACAFWNLTSPFGWAADGLRLSAIYRHNVQCTSTHLTHFGHLLYQSVTLSAQDERALVLITTIGCTMSLLGILGIFVTATRFPMWRRTDSTKFLLQFSAAIAMQLFVFVLMHADVNILPPIIEMSDTVGCIVLGATQHYALLVVFLWKLIIAYLQFMRYVVVFNSAGTGHHLFVKASVLGWSLPLGPVIVVLLVDPNLYVPLTRITSPVAMQAATLCYPRSYALYFGVMLPIGFVIVANLCVFIAVLWSLMGSPKFRGGVEQSAAATARTQSVCGLKTDRKTAMAQLRLSVFLFFLLGLTWFFGFLSGVGVVFLYLFCITATIQGFILFLYFVILDPVARNLWIDSLRNVKRCRDPDRRMRGSRSAASSTTKIRKKCVLK